MGVVDTLEVCRLKKELAIVKAENEFLRESITKLIFGETSKSTKSLPAIQLQKWAYYHEHKEEIAKQISDALKIPVDVISWCVVKRKSDEIFHRTFEHTLSNTTSNQELSSVSAAPVT